MNELVIEEMNLTIERTEDAEIKGETVRRKWKMNIVVAVVVVAQTQSQSHLSLPPLIMVVFFFLILQPLFSELLRA